MIRSTEATKYFGALCAVDQVNAEIHNGSVFGLIGSNGAANRHSCACWPEFCSRTAAA